VRRNLLNGNLLRDADFDSLFLCTAYHGIYPDPCQRVGFAPVGRAAFPAQSAFVGGEGGFRTTVATLESARCRRAYAQREE
jgi:hypothetical protein